MCSCRLCIILTAGVAVVLAIGLAWESTFELELEVTVDAKPGDVFNFLSDPYVSKKFHPFVYKIDSKDRGYIRPGVRLYELVVSEQIDVLTFESTTDCITNKTIDENRREIVHEAVCVDGVVKTNITWSVQCASGDSQNSCLQTVITETASTTVPILLKTYVMTQQEAAHQRTFDGLKNHFKK